MLRTHVGADVWRRLSNSQRLAALLHDLTSQEHNLWGPQTRRAQVVHTSCAAMQQGMGGIAGATPQIFDRCAADNPGMILYACLGPSRLPESCLPGLEPFSAV